MAEREAAGIPRERRRTRRTNRFLLRMLVFLVMVGALAVALGQPLATAFMGNPAVNGVILGILLAGIVYIFRQVLLLNPESDWIDSFRERLANRELTAPPGPPPRLLASMARLLGARQGGRVSLSPTSLQTLLDGIASRLDETRETSRYLIGVLIFLGLLGTFYGLLETVRSVGGVIAGLNASANDVARAFADLKAGLAGPLSGMGTAFSASLFGLAGSLVLGFLDLQASQAQNAFYNDLEEWLTGRPRLSGVEGPGLEGVGGAPMPAYVSAMLQQTADNLDRVQSLLTRSEDNRGELQGAIGTLSKRLAAISERLTRDQELVERLL